MLELAQIVREIDALTLETAARSVREAGQLTTATDQARMDADTWQPHVKRIEDAQTKWLAAKPLGTQPVADTTAVGPLPKTYTALAADGSQIPIDRHAPALCYVLNIGEIALHYGSGERPRLTARASLHYKEEDILPYGEDGEASIVTEREIATRRLLAEARSLKELIAESAARENAVALLDGTLILWAQEAEADERKKQVIAEFCALLAFAQEANVPIAGYLSSPNSREVVNALRITLCPDQPVICKNCRHDQKNLPCAPINRVTDAGLFAQILSPGERSGLFESRSRVLDHYAPADQKIAFYYLNAGAEIARIEVPLWVANDPQLVAQTHALILDQAQKGNGYPVCLTEAHERAVVRAPEREAFFRFVERAFAQKNVRVTTSRKAFSKRTRVI